MLSTDINEILRDANFKDEKPLKTVERIKKILQTNNIETEERWHDSGVPYCYSLRITVRGTSFGANGKGLTREFAMASGYGELMERLQLGYDFQKTGPGLMIDSKALPLQNRELLKHNRHWYENFAEQVNFLTGTQLSPEDILEQFTNSDGTIEASPYFCVNTGIIEYFPIHLRKTVYGTNGCAAGNTPEEAIVQALSEIVERKHQTDILMQDIATPEISDNVLKQYSVAYHIITHLRSMGFQILVKDCSLGTKFPVVCVCFIDTKTGKYHEHFGAYPIFEIALERALTETFQGRNIDSFAQFEDFLYPKTNRFPLNELTHSFVKGTSKEKPSFFINHSVNAWNKSCGFCGQNNKQLLRECISFFTDQGFDVLIRDCSCLGFPTYQIIIPGYSEILVHRLSPKHNEILNRPETVRVLRNPAHATTDDILCLFSYIEKAKKYNKNLLFLHFPDMASLQIPTMTVTEGEKFLAMALGCVFYTLGQYGTVLEYIQQTIPRCNQEEQEYLICLKRYLSMKQHKYDESEIRTLLNIFHKPETVLELYSCITENRNPLERFCLHCNEQCNVECPLVKSCCTQNTNKLSNIIRCKSEAMNFEASIEQMRNLL